MSDEKQLLHELGAFDPMQAKRLLPLLEQSGIPFEVETDDVQLDQPNSFPALQFGLTSDGAKLLVFVSADHLSRAADVARQAFPDFKLPSDDPTPA
ncbi:MAG: hypothetical protein EXS32_11255 [Opitutus sp.]|nr:hypothetical protein [Opitutus sp.]